MVAEPAGSSMAAMATASAEGPSYGGKEPPPPTWDGSDPGYELANFEKNVKLWLFESELEPKKRGVRLLRSLTGVARSVVDTLDFDEVACEKGGDNIVQTLRKHFAPHLEVSLPRAFERAVYGAPRGAKESMQEYLIRCERNFNLLEKEELKLPPGAVGYIMYRQASLTEGQELKFATWSGGKYDAATVISCLRKLDKVIPEHKTRSSTAFVQEGLDGEDEVYLIDPEDALEDDEYIFLDETDQGQVMEEEDVQLALATYQEIRKAINAQQKGRQFYNGKGGGRGPQGYKTFFKGKQKIRVEELKLRTRCGRCGQVGHWAKECVNEPDERGKKFAAKSSSAASSGSQMSGSTAQQSWYVAAGSGVCDSNQVEQVFTFVCRGDHTVWESDMTVQESVGVRNLDYEDKSTGEPDLSGIVRDVVVDAAPIERCSEFEPPDPFGLFIGLTTTPTMAVVDTAAQDGLIGSHALERLKEQLALSGLQIVWTGRQAKAHGVGGQAKVLGIAAIPLGIAGTSGILEATVVEGEIPLLLPIKMLRHLRAVIDLSSGCVQFHELHKTVPLFVLPSGHVAIEICQFGPEGFSLQDSMRRCGMHIESDFRLVDGSSNSTVMLSQFVQPHLSSSRAAASNVSLLRNGPVGQLSKIDAVSRRCGYGSGEGGVADGTKSQEGMEELAGSPGQGVLSSAPDWIRGVGALVASGGGDLRGFFPSILHAARRRNQRSREDAVPEVEDGTTTSVRGRMSSFRGSPTERRKPIHRVGDMHGLLREMESATAAEEGEEHPQGRSSFEGKAERIGVDGKVIDGVLQPSKVHEGDGSDGDGPSGEGGDLRAGGHEEECREVEDRGSRDQEVGRGVEAGSDAVPAPDQDPQLGDEGGQVTSQRNEEDYEDARDHDVRVRHHGNGSEVLGAEAISGWRDVGMGRGQVEDRGRVGDVGSSTEGEQPVHGTAGESSRGFEHGPGDPGSEEGQIPIPNQEVKKSENWVWTRSLKKEIQKVENDGFFMVEEVVVQEESGVYVAGCDEVDSEDEGFLRIDFSKRMKMEDEIEEVKETALSKGQKKKLKRAEEDNKKDREVLAVGVSEVFSPPRFTKEACKQGVSFGKAYDLETGYDLRCRRDQQRMWRVLQQDDPELVTGSPPCTPFSVLQSLNFPKMDLEKAIHMVGEGLLHVRTTVRVCKWQYRRGKIFLFEHPLGSRAFQEEELLELMQLPGVYVCQADMCEYGMNVNGQGLNRKSTQWITNSRHIARRLQRRCGGGHHHVALMGGLAEKAAEYPAALCKEVLRGLKEHLRERYGQTKEIDKEQVVFVEEAAEKEDEESSSSSSESSSEDEEEVKKTLGRVKVLKELEDARGKVHISAAEKTKLRIMHVNLGHPSKVSFIRFLRAGRVREELIRWVRTEFECATCQSSVMPKAPRPAVVPRGYAPGVAVGIDLFYVPDVMNQKSLPVLNVVDVGTNYQMVEILENKEPAHIWRTFWRVWARTFGLPQYVAIDEGREFRSHFAKLCASAGTIVFRSAARAPWQQGRVERHGAILKNMLEKSRGEMVPGTPEELLHLLHACECAKNRYSNRSGYSPTQRQIGQWPRMPSSLVSDEEIDPSLQAQNCTDDFEKLMEMRKIAQDAFMKLNCSEAAVKALKARPRLQREFKAGDVVYVYRALRKRKTVHGGNAVRGGGMGRKATWVGPGHVLALEGSVVWINMLGELWRAAVEQVRMASSTEKFGSELIAEHCEEMQERLKRSAHRSGYRDVSHEEWPELDAGDGEVDKEGEERGRPRVRFDEEEQQRADEEYTPSFQGDEAEGVEEDQGRRVSIQTELEPEEETPVLEESILDEERAEAEEERLQEMTRVVEENDRRDGVRRNSFAGK